MVARYEEEGAKPGVRLPQLKLYRASCILKLASSESVVVHFHDRDGAVVVARDLDRLDSSSSRDRGGSAVNVAMDFIDEVLAEECEQTTATRSVRCRGKVVVGRREAFRGKSNRAVVTMNFLQHQYLHTHEQP